MIRMLGTKLCPNGGDRLSLSLTTKLERQAMETMKVSDVTFEKVTYIWQTSVEENLHSELKIFLS